MATFKKGDAVWHFLREDSGKVYVRKIILTSWGKKQGTAVGHENGQPVQHRLYPQDVDGHPVYWTNTRVRLVSEMPDPAPFARELGAKSLARARQHYADLIARGTGGPHYQRIMERSLEEANAATPRVIMVEGFNRTEV